jgi:hypothetical protein
MTDIDFKRKKLTEKKNAGAIAGNFFWKERV